MAIALTSSTLPTSLSLLKSVKPRRYPCMVVLVSCRSTSAMDTNLGMSKSTNFYGTLSLSPRSNRGDDIKKAFRSMALQYHPDVCDPSTRLESTRMFVRLHEACRTLSDPVLREEYNYSQGLVSRPRSEGGNKTVAEEVGRAGHGVEEEVKQARREKKGWDLGKSHEV